MKATVALLCCLLLLVAGCMKTEVKPLLPAPEVMNISPSSAMIGETVVVAGKGFLTDPSANVVSFGGKVAVISSVSGDSELTVIVPNGAVSGAIVVGNANASTIGPVFTVLVNPNPPTLTALSSVAVEIGEVIEILGTNFYPSVTDTSVNQVLIGVLRLPIVKATSTRITALVPAGTIGADQNLVVNVRGGVSNALKVGVTGFSGSLFWTQLPNVNLPEDNIRQLIAQVAADGSTPFNNRLSVAILDDSIADKFNLKYLFAGPKAFSTQSNSLYYAREERDTLWRLKAPSFDQFEKVFSSEEAQVPLNAVTAITIKDDMEDVFLAYNTIINRNSQFFGFVASGIIEQMVAGQDALYLLVKDGLVSSIQKIPYTSVDGFASVVTTYTLPTGNTFGARGIASILYGAGSKSFYFIQQEKSDALSKLYQLSVADESITLVADNLPGLGDFSAPPSTFSLLDAPTGPKIYHALGDVIYLINLKVNTEGMYAAIPLYLDALRLAGRPETFQFQPDFNNDILKLPFPEIDFLFADDN